MMQKFTNLFLFVGLLFSGSLMAQDILWPDVNDADQVASSTFDGGLNDWVAEGLRSADNNESVDGVLWNWSSDGVEQGFFFNGFDNFNSPTIGNGCAQFESDFLDNANNLTLDMDNNVIWDNMGTGAGPATSPIGCDVDDDPDCRLGHAGQLTSPSIDLSNSGPGVVLRFNQYYARLGDANGNTQFCFVEISNDGGNAWTRYSINGDAELNDPQNGVILLDVSALAANESDVKVRFIFDGYYYFWMIDDVQFTSIPEFNIGINNFFYGVNRFTPASQIADDTVGFWVSPSNYGNDLEDVTLRVEVTSRDENGNIIDLLHEEDLVLPIFNEGVIGGDQDDDGGVDTAFFFENSWAPGDLPVGLYAIVYIIDHADIEMDADPNDNAAVNFFEVTEDFYGKEDRNTTGIQTGDGGSYAIGNMYRTTETFGNVGYVATDAFFGAVVNQGDGPISNYGCDVYLMQLKEDEFPGFPNFDFMGEIAGNPGFVDEDSGIVGFAQHSFTENGNQEEGFVALESLTQGPAILDPNSFYFLMFDYMGNEVPFHLSNASDFQYWQISTVVKGSQWFLGGFGSDVAAGGRLIIEMTVSADAEILDETNVTTSPNPTTDFINVAVNFAEPTEAHIIMTDMDGKILHMEEHDGVQNEVFNVDVSSFVPGTYTVHVNTPLGISTDKVVVID